MALKASSAAVVICISLILIEVKPYPQKGDKINQLRTLNTSENLSVPTILNARKIFIAPKPSELVEPTTKEIQSQANIMKCPNGKSLRSPVNLHAGPIGIGSFGIKSNDPWDADLMKATRHVKELEKAKSFTLDQQTISNGVSLALILNIFYGMQRNNFFVRLDGTSLWFRLMEIPDSELTLNFTFWSDEYVFAMGRLVWGAEHTLDREILQLEVQLYHYRKKDGDLETARANNGLLLVSRLFRETKHWEGNKVLDTLIASAEKVKGNLNGSFTKVRGSLKLGELFPSHTETQDVLHYLGTETVFPCDDASWLVFQSIGNATSGQIQRLLELNKHISTVSITQLADLRLFSKSNGHGVAIRIETSLAIDGANPRYYCKSYPVTCLLGLFSVPIIINLISFYACTYFKEPRL